MDKTMTIRPRLSEKAYALSQTNNVYVFEVPSEANKVSVAQAITAQYGVEVVEVNLLNVKGKVKRTIRRGGRQTLGKRKDIKKVYVTLKDGDSLPIFAAEEEADKKAAKQAAKEKK